MKGKLLMAALGLSISCQLSAQIMKSGGEILDGVEGTTLVTFSDSTTLYSEIETPLWYAVSKRIIFEEDDLNADSTLSEGAEIFDYEGEPIGRVNSTVEVSEIYEHRGFRMSSYRTGIIKGFVSKFDTYTGTRPEDAISNAFGGARRVSGRDLESKLKELGFKREESNGMNVWVLRNVDEENSEYNEFPFRVLVVMRGNNIQCIVTTTERISINSERDYYEERGRHFSWLTQPNDRNKETISNIVYEYLPL